MNVDPEALPETHRRALDVVVEESAKWGHTTTGRVRGYLPRDTNAPAVVEDLRRAGLIERVRAPSPVKRWRPVGA